MHDTTKKNMEHMNAKYKLVGDKGRKHFVFESGDIVWLNLCKDMFLDFHKSKLMHNMMVLLRA